MVDNSSWMGDVLRDHPDFGDIPITQMALAGSHDSGTIHMDTRARTQDRTIGQQLQLGLRYFDIRPSLNNDDYYVHHGALGSDNILARRPAPPDLDKGDEIFAQIRRFLKANPKEVVILRYGDYRGFTEDQDYADFVGLMQTYFTITEPVSSRCALVTLPKGSRPEVNKQTLNTLTGSGKRVFVIFEIKNVPADDARIWDFVFHCRESNHKPLSREMVLWDPYWEEESISLADDDAANVQDVWFPWHEKNLKTWNRDGFFVLQSQMQVLHPTGNGAPGYFNKAERSARATSKLYRYQEDGYLIGNNDRNGSRYVSWLQAGRAMNIITFDFAQYGGLPDKIIAHYRGWKLVANNAESGAADWHNKLLVEHDVSAGEAARIANSDPRIGFFFHVKGPEIVLSGKGKFPRNTAVFFSGTPQKGHAQGLADLYVK